MQWAGFWFLSATTKTTVLIKGSWKVWFRQVSHLQSPGYCPAPTLSNRLSCWAKKQPVLGPDPVISIWGSFHHPWLQPAPWAWPMGVALLSQYHCHCHHNHHDNRFDHHCHIHLHSRIHCRHMIVTFIITVAFTVVTSSWIWTCLTMSAALSSQSSTSPLPGVPRSGCWTWHGNMFGSL